MSNSSEKNTETIMKKVYQTPEVHHVGSLDKVQAFIDARVAEGSTSGYYDNYRNY
jgi:hypothetical protein